ncbi:MAG: TIGR00153 family protein [Candidatus Pelagadaptatus aseana]|uniref:TIGR00153 family protein n=1 Tax=Candidatus Pelagadaptatus aseana TaxID=3120508 RepID=UPI0039B2E0FF
MPISNPLANLFGKSPITPIQEHMAASHNAAALLADFFDASNQEDWEKAEEIQQKISEQENLADDLKKQIRLELPKSLFLPVPRGDLLELLSMQDQIANCAKDIAGIMLGREMRMPKKIRKDMTAFVKASIATSEQAMTAINELDELLEAGFGGPEVKLVQKLIKKLDDLENKTDKLQISIRSKLFKVEKDLPPVDVMFTYQIIEWVGELADKAQKVGSRLQMLLAR